MDIISRYFPDLSQNQLQKLEELKRLLADWNTRINVISRKDIQALEEKHLLHSLSPGIFFPFPAGIKVLDAGSGGGLPGLPLAILFPEVSFYLVDSVGKKVRVMQDIAEQLELTNVKAMQERVENIRGGFHYVLARAFTRLNRLYEWTSYRITAQAPIPPGIIAFKGGDINEEIRELPAETEQYPLFNSLPLEHYQEKKLVFVPFGNR